MEFDRTEIAACDSPPGERPPASDADSGRPAFDPALQPQKPKVIDVFAGVGGLTVITCNTWATAKSASFRGLRFAHPMSTEVHRSATRCSKSKPSICRTRALRLLELCRSHTSDFQKDSNGSWLLIMRLPASNSIHFPFESPHVGFAFFTSRLTGNWRLRDRTNKSLMTFLPRLKTTVRFFITHNSGRPMRCRAKHAIESPLARPELRDSVSDQSLSDFVLQDAP